MIQALVFDWGDTIMRDYPENPGPMSEWEHVEWIPGAEKALQELSDKYIMVIATNAGHSNTEAMIAALKRVGADQYFRHFFSSKDLKYVKPDVRFFETIAQKINMLPQHCVMIGNLYEKDIVGAKQCGMSTVLFNEKKEIRDFVMADAVIHDMFDLPEAIKLLG